MLQDGESVSGSLNTVVRLGNTVRRPMHNWTPTVTHFLEYLGQKGICEVPTPLGVDEQNREIQTFIPGEVALRPWPALLKTNQGLEIITRFVKQYHQAQADYIPPANATWYVPDVQYQPGNIIRHGDLGPWNTIWTGDTLQGVIDWDFAEPGDPLTDLAQLAWYWVPLRGEKGWREAGFEQAPHYQQRLTVICDTYGTKLNKLIEAVLYLQILEMKRLEKFGRKGLFPWVLYYKRGDLSEMEAEYQWLKAHWSALLN
ncbi:MAG TPA: hypothetical protein DCS93_13980 [Microscillaceae bacterium]|nr:hypothetical protein [Microscillaceae bacterium]